MPQSNRLYTAGDAAAAQPRRVAINVQGSNNAFIPTLQSFTGTSETQFNIPSLSIPLAVAIPPGGPCEQEQCTLIASGYIKTGQSSTVVLKLYAGDSATIGSNTQIGASTSVTVATATVPFLIKCDFVYDSVSGDLDILSFSAVVKGTVNTTIAGSPPYSLSLSNTANPVLTFTLTATFGTGSAGTPNSINLKDFGVNH
jgi:hypothetical protein